MSGESGAVSEKFLFPALLAVLAAACTGISSLFLCVAKPYMIEAERSVGSVDHHRTFFVINQGPWKKRPLRVEIASTSDVSFVCSSIRLREDRTANKMSLILDEALPPGCVYTFTLKDGSTNGSIDVALFCDADRCVAAPFCNLQFILRSLCIVVCVLIAGLVLSIWRWAVARRAANSEINSTLRQAVTALIAKRAAPGTIRAAQRDAQTFKERSDELAKLANPKSTRKRAKKNPPAPQP